MKFFSRLPLTNWPRYGALIVLLGFIGCGTKDDAPANSPPTQSQQSVEAVVDPAPVQSDVAAVVPGQAATSLRDDPAMDGWKSEVFGSQVSQQLKQLSRLIEHPETITLQALEQLAEPDFSCTALRPETLTDAYTDSTFTVQRADNLESLEANLSGLGSLAIEIARLAAPFQSLTEVRSKIKVFHVDSANEPTDGSLVTDIYYQLSGQSAAGRRQLNATWRCEWKQDAESSGAVSSLPRLASIRVTKCDETVTRQGEEALFAEVTQAVLGGNDSFTRQLLPGVDHWLGRIEAKFGMDIGAWQGITIGDVNGDSLDDLYVCQPGGLPNRLFVQNADGTATDLSHSAGVDWLDSSHGALLVDLDNDGDQDLVVGVSAGVMIMTNDGTGVFSLLSPEALPAAIPYSISAADYDADGDLDLFICCYNRRRGVNRHLLFARPVPYHDANNGGRNVLLRNDGDGKFTHVTKAVGLDENNRRFSYAAAWEDYDADGDLDLYVANDFGRNNLYENLGGQFRDVAKTAGVEDISPGMSACWGDYDNDGRPDLYVSNMFSAAGNRITFQQGFQTQADEKTRSQFQRHARGNSLFRNLGNGRFADQSVEAGVTLGRWAWGSNFVDINNDGWLDVVVANGFITQDDSDDL